MIKNWLAILGVLILLVSGFLGLAWSEYERALRELTPDLEALVVWPFLQKYVDLTPNQVLFLIIATFLLGVALTIPWWLARLQKETIWWEKRDEPLDPPPRAGV